LTTGKGAPATAAAGQIAIVQGANGLAAGAFDLMQIAPAGFVDHSVKVYVSPTERDFPGG